MIILFNGPPESGKDVACDFVRNKFGFNKVSFKKTLFDDVKRIFNISDENFKDFMTGYNDRNRKDIERLSYLGKMTRREAMIFASEVVMKKIWGKGHYGEALGNTPLSPFANYCSSDCGFIEEAEALHKIYDKIVVYQIIREGKTFEGDSRSYIDSESIGIPAYKIFNNGTIEEFYEEIRKLTEEVRYVNNF